MEGEKIHTWGVRVMLGEVGLVQLSNREPKEVLEQRSGVEQRREIDVGGKVSWGDHLCPGQVQPLPCPTPLAVLR